MTPYNSSKHHRRSIRLKRYDYSQPGAYFIALVSYQREEFFGKIVNGQVQLSDLGQIVQEEWLRSSGIRKEISLNEDEFIVMPNHLPGIVWIIAPERINEEVKGAHEGARRTPQREDGEEPGSGKGARLAPQPEEGENQGARCAPQQRTPKSLGSMIAGFKAGVTSRARRELDFEVIWQRNYYEDIIRDESDFLRIWEYIDHNPLRWHEDRFRSTTPPNRFHQKKLRFTQ